MPSPSRGGLRFRGRKTLIGFFLIGALAVLPGAGAFPKPPGHLAYPESAIFHQGTIYVTLMGSAQGEGARDGSIVAVNRAGRVLRTVATGLVDPTGMTVMGSTLWVNDFDKIRSFALPSGTAGKVHDLSALLPAGSFLNDLAADRSGQLWATNTSRNRIHVVRTDGRVDTFTPPAEFAFPNGIALHPKTNQLWFMTNKPGGGAAVARITPSGYVLVRRNQAFVGLDGLDFIQQTVVTKTKQGKKKTTVVSAVFSDYRTNVIWKLQGSKLTRRATIAGAPGDLSYAASLGVLVIPLWRAGEFTTLKP